MILGLFLAYWIGWVVGAGVGAGGEYAKGWTIVFAIVQVVALSYYAGKGLGVW